MKQRLNAGERLPIETEVQVRNKLGRVVGHIEPDNFGEVVAHVVRFDRKTENRVMNLYRVVPIKPQTLAVNYSSIFYETH